MMTTTFTCLSILLALLINSSSSLTMLSNIPNKLQNIKGLHNKFFGLRHGQSLANVAKIISSDPSISTVEHGLSELGKEQVTNTAKNFCKNYMDNSCSERYSGVAIYSSDFTRARETAGIFAYTLIGAGIPLLHHNDDLGSINVNNTSSNANASTSGNVVKHDIRLRERYFGDFNGKSDSHYQDVWDVDCVDADHTEFNCESVNSVVSRTSQLIFDIDNELKALDEMNMEGTPGTEMETESESKPRKVILVAHGDVLQILQTAYLKKEGSVHRSLEHLDTAGLREYILGDNES